MCRGWMLVKSSLILLGLIAAGISHPWPAHAANAQSALVDGAIGESCRWHDAMTSANPPNPTTIDRTTVHVTCDDGSDAPKLENDPTVTFNDAAEIDQFRISLTFAGITCVYAGYNMRLQSGSAGGGYRGGPYTFRLVSGSFLCPDTVTVDSLWLQFH